MAEHEQAELPERGGRYAGDWLRATSGLLVLTVIAQHDQKPGAYGREIAREIDRRSGGLFDLRQGSIYPMLTEFLRAGLVEMEVVVPEKGPLRRCYLLTEAGKEELGRLRKLFDAHIGAVYGVLNGGGASV